MLIELFTEFWNGVKRGFLEAQQKSFIIIEKALEDEHKKTEDNYQKPKDNC